MATGTEDGRVAAHVFVHDLDEPQLDDEDRHHLERVLRLRVGEAVSASDGQGGLRACVFATEAGLEPTGPVRRLDARTPLVAVGFALVKGERPEWAVQKLTECGVDRILPFTAARSVVRWDDDKALRHLERFRRVAREAAMQSRQAWLPTVEGVRPFGAVADAESAAAAIADMGAPPLTLDHPSILVGPEGGWTEEERTRLPAVSLGPSVLRAETAAVAAAVLLTALRSATVGPHRVAVRGQ